MDPSRRDVLRFGAFGAGTLLLPGASFPAGLQPDADPHFFLLIVLNGGADSSYMFDARPLSMTRASRTTYVNSPSAVVASMRSPGMSSSRRLKTAP